MRSCTAYLPAWSPCRLLSFYPHSERLSAAMAGVRLIRSLSVHASASRIMEAWVTGQGQGQSA